MSPITLNAVRYGIPAVLFVTGMVVWGIGSVAAGAMFISAATAVLLLNFLPGRLFAVSLLASSTSTAAGRTSDPIGRSLRS